MEDTLLYDAPKASAVEQYMSCDLLRLIIKLFVDNRHFSGNCSNMVQSLGMFIYWWTTTKAVIQVLGNTENINKQTAHRMASGIVARIPMDVTNYLTLIRVWIMVNNIIGNLVYELCMKVRGGCRTAPWSDYTPFFFYKKIGLRRNYNLAAIHIELNKRISESF